MMMVAGGDGALPPCPPCPPAGCPWGDDVVIPGRPLPSRRSPNATTGAFDPIVISGSINLQLFALSWQAEMDAETLLRMEAGRPAVISDGYGDLPDTVRDVSCVTDKPTKHGNIADIFQAAIDLKEKMPYHHNLTPGLKFEYFGVVWKMPGGAVQTTEPTTSGKVDRVEAKAVWEALDSIPNGAIILGIFHSQPDNGIMSPTDWNAHKMIFNNPDSPSFIGKPGSFAISDSIGRGITSDPNGLSFVYDMSTGKIHVYDKSDKDSDKLQCQINNIRGSR